MKPVRKKQETCRHWWVATGQRALKPLSVEGMEIKVRHAEFRCRNCGAEAWFRDEVPTLSLDYFVKTLEKIFRDQESH